MSRTVSIPKEERENLQVRLPDVDFACMECNRKFRSLNAAMTASTHGCPDCNGLDIDLYIGGVLK